MYLTLEEYKTLGGKADETTFPLLERRAEKRLDYWTQGRITDVSDDIKLCMTLIVDALAEMESDERKVSSFSNDGVSVTLCAPSTDGEQMGNVYNQVIEILPMELVSLVIE